MTKEEIFHHYESYLDNLIDNNDYFKYYFQFPWSPEDDILFDDSAIKFGATRGCIIDYNFPYVVKFDLYVDQYDDFSNCCEKEVDTYLVAERANFEKYFVECGFLGVYYKKINYYDAEEINCEEGRIEYYDRENLNDFSSSSQIEKNIYIRLYYYEKIDDAFNKNNTYAVNVVNSSRRCKSPLIDRNKTIGYEFIQEYGEEEYIEFSRFLRCIGVNDIHTDNIGLKEGHLKIIDWAGFNENFRPSDMLQL